jgi:hypothetical protein
MTDRDFAEKIVETIGTVVVALWIVGFIGFGIFAIVSRGSHPSHGYADDDAIYEPYTP